MSPTMTVKELLEKLNRIVKEDPEAMDALIVGSGDEDAGGIYEASYIKNCGDDELPYDGGGATDEYINHDIVVLYGYWN